MKFLVTGVNGQLGHDVLEELISHGHEVAASGSGEAYSGLNADRLPYLRLDITDAAAVREAVTALKPDAVIHCSAWTAVDAAEDAENYERVMALNALAPGYFAAACRECGAKLVYISTDYVFDGSGEAPWEPDCEDFAPLNVYGASKLAGEKAVRENTDRYFIVRTSWVFGVNGSNFIKTMINAGKKRDFVRVVCDQTGTPTYTRDLARLLADMAETEKFGCYHASNEGGYISWYDFCCEFYRQYGLRTVVIPVTTEEYGLSKAARPHNSRLDKSKLKESGFTPLPPWQDAVQRFLKEAQL